MGFLENVDRDGPRMDLDARDVASTAALKMHKHLSPVSDLRTRIARSHEKAKIN